MSYIAQIFPSDTAASVFYLVYFLWPVSEFVGGAVIPRLRRRGVSIKREDRSSRLLIFLSIFLSLAVAWSFATVGIAMLPTWVYYPGVAAMILGIALRQWSIAVLGRFFSGAVGVQAGQTVVDKGPYRLVRHPSYTGALLILVGLGLALQSWGAILAIVSLFGVAFGYRMSVEEKVLTSQLGDEYIQYTKRTKRLIPFVL